MKTKSADKNKTGDLSVHLRAQGTICRGRETEIVVTLQAPMGVDGPGPLLSPGALHVRSGVTDSDLR